MRKETRHRTAQPLKKLMGYEPEDEGVCAADKSHKAELKARYHICAM